VNINNLLFKYVRVNCTGHDVFRHTPLTHAAANGHVVVVRVLLEGGADVERVNADQCTSLHEAGMDI
jgi:ankyrin repeat protein